MFETYIFPILLFAALGLVAALLLTIANHVFHVRVDARIEALDNALPHANCGACGFAGCGEYAEAIVQKNAPTNLCKPGGSEVAAQLAGIMGTAALAVEPECAVVRCQGDCDATRKQFDFGGIQSCQAAKRFYGGPGSCLYGCIGLGDCANVCDRNAICIVNGIASVRTDLCGACGQCVKVCPNQLIALMPVRHTIQVRCSSHANGKITKSACENGCIGCKRCEKECLHDAIHVENFLAVIDPLKCAGCGACWRVCPTVAITCSNPDVIDVQSKE